MLITPCGVAQTDSKGEIIEEFLGIMRFVSSMMDITPTYVKGMVLCD